jgi:hypothetical protein
MLKYVNAVDNSGNAPIFDPATTKHTHAMISFTTADMKLLALTKKKTDIVADYLQVPTRWVTVLYAQNGFACVKTLNNERQYWVKMKGRKIASVAPVV